MASDQKRPNGDALQIATIYDRITELLRSDIASGRLAPNERLKAPEIAKRFGVSPSPVREALQKLQSEGLVVLKPNQGAMVREITAVEFAHISRVRLAVEMMQARLCAEIRTSEIVKSLKAAAEAFEEAVKKGDVARRLQANQAFHRAIIGCDSNAWAQEIVDRSYSITAALRRIYAQSDERMQSAVAEHYAIIDAIEAQDPETAAQLMQEHASVTINDILTKLGSSQ